MREVAESSVEELFDVEGLSQEQASLIHKNARLYVEQHGDESDEGDSDDAKVSDLERLAISADVREVLLAGGYRTIQSLVEADDDTLRQISGIDEGDVSQIREAVDSFLRAGTVRSATPFLA